MPDCAPANSSPRFFTAFPLSLSRFLSLVHGNRCLAPRHATRYLFNYRRRSLPHGHEYATVIDPQTSARIDWGKFRFRSGATWTVDRPRGRALVDFGFNPQGTRALCLDTFRISLTPRE